MADSIPSSIQSDFPIGCGPRKTCDEITPSSTMVYGLRAGRDSQRNQPWRTGISLKTIRRDMDDNFIGNNYCKVRSSTLTNKFWGPGLSTCQFIRTKMGQIIEVHVHRMNGWLKPFSGWPWGIRSFQASAGLAGCIADVLFGGFFIENHAE